MRPFYRFCHSCCQAAFLTFSRGRTFGRANVPAQGGALLVCNHQSFLDPVLATCSLDRECHFMARDTLFANPAFGWLIDTLNAFPVKRGEGDVGAIKETLRRLKRGALITVFPEGTRTPDGAIGPMRSGVVLLARKARVPLVPTLILGAFDAWPRRQLLPSPSPVLVAHAEPLTPEQIDAMEPEACMDAVRARIVAMRQRFGPHTLLQRR